jgi:hypothetical protein
MVVTLSRSRAVSENNAQPSGRNVITTALTFQFWYQQKVCWSVVGACVRVCAHILSLVFVRQSNSHHTEVR